MTVMEFLDRTRTVADKVKMYAYDDRDFGYCGIIVNHDTEEVILYETDDDDVINDIGDFRREVQEACMNYIIIDEGKEAEVENIIFGTFLCEVAIYLVST